MSNEMTKNDIKKIEEEIEYRKVVVRKDAIEAVKEARAHGDLSENFEYYAAKRDKNKNESRIRYLERLVKNAVIIEDDTKEDEVGLYSIVDLYFEEDDEIETVKLVTSIRGDSMKGNISIDSPLGNAIKGHKVNDRIFIKVSDDYGYYVVIKKIERTKDDGSDEIRSY
ncbi:MAG: transcription elongation factor GreA [Lachnospiraceae bacterium]|nr:transcription elongation factor GreA [Lachnospiraceae bacterium]